MIPILYPSNATDFSTYGLGALTDTISCEVTEERNGVFECLLKYPITGQHYDSISKECIIKAKPNDTAEPQAFRIYRITKPLNGIVTIYGQHISYDLANVPMMPFQTESRSPALILSQLLAGDSRFTGWTDYNEAKPFVVTQPKSVRACLGGSEESMLSKWHGEYEWDNFTVKLHTHRGQKTGVVIEYGKNLTALEQDEDNSSVYTKLLPYAVQTAEDGTETVITLPEETLPIVSGEMAREKTLIRDFTDQFESGEQITEETLRAAANDYIRDNPLGATIPSVKVSFEPLWKQQEYAALLERVNLCDTVTIRHSSLGVSVSAMVIQTVYDSLAEKYISITLGNEKSSMVTTVSEIQSSVDKVQSAVGRFPKLLQSAIDSASSLITGQTGGYVVLHGDESGQPYELLILDAPSIDEAVNVWRWNVGGLGFSHNGYNGPYETAITADGQIVADFITSGSLTANIIKVGVIQSQDDSSWWDLESGEVHLSAYTTKKQVEEIADKAAGKGPEKSVDYYLVTDKSKGITTASEGWTTTPPLTTAEKPYLWHYKVDTYKSGQTVTTTPAVIGTHGTAGKDGKDSILLHIESSGGNIFKNSSIATILSVTIIVGNTIISGSREAKDFFGNGVKLIWQEKRLGEDEFLPLAEDDLRLSDGGFLLTLNPQDIETKSVFRCLLDV